jgi:hypothetical protein
VKHELQKHLLPLILVFILASVLWVIFRDPWYNFILLFLGLAIGSFFLDLDHLVYWLYTHPQLEESHLALATLKKKDYRNTLKLLEATHKNHTDLIFHHIIFQLVLLAVSLFVFTSTSSIFGQAFLFALNLHLLIDEYEDWQNNPTHLQKWLFARLSKQIPQSFLKKYLLIVACALALCLFLLIQSKT